MMKLRLNPHYRLQFEKAQNAWVMLYPEGMVKLNTTAASILQLCNGQNDTTSILANLGEQYSDLDASQVKLFLKEARKRLWVMVSPGEGT